MLSNDLTARYIELRISEQQFAELSEHIVAVVSLTSYLPAERREAANERLVLARADVDRLHRAWESRNPSMDPDERRMLREELQGAKGQVGTWTRYIKNGCPRGR